MVPSVGVHRCASNAILGSVIQRFTNWHLSFSWSHLMRVVAPHQKMIAGTPLPLLIHRVTSDATTYCFCGALDTCPFVL